MKHIVFHDQMCTKKWVKLGIFAAQLQVSYLKRDFILIVD
jgi:hypothetical protein